MFAYHRFILALGCALLLSSVLLPCSATGRTDDVPLSTEPLSLVLPASAQIQSAARLGDVTLVVWGTTRSTGDTSVASSLVMQFLRDTVPEGPQHALTTDAARPFGFVQVIPFHDRFLVAWNDARNNDTTAYAQLVDTAGTMIGKETKFSPTLIDSFGIARVIRPDGYRLLWNGPNVTSAHIYWRDIDSVGIVSGPVQGPLAGELQQVLAPAELSGIVILHRGMMPPLIYHPDGTFDTLRGKALRHFFLPYYLDDDGSLVTLDSGRVRFYQTILDSVEYRSIPIPAGIAINPGTMFITRTQSGNIALMWTSGGSGTFPGMALGGALVAADIFKSVLTPADTFDAPTLVNKFAYRWVSNHYVLSRSFAGSRLIRGCGNHYYIEVTFNSTLHFQYQTIDTTTYFTQTGSFNVDGEGNLYRLDIPYSSQKPEWPLSIVCQDAPDVPVIRLPSGKSNLESSVLVSTAYGDVRLDALAARVGVNVPEQKPSIRRVGDDLIVSWLTLGMDSVAEAGRIRASMDGVAKIGDVVINSPRTSGDARANLSIGSYIWNQADNFFLERRERWRDSVSIGGTTDRQRSTLYTAGTTGWNQSALFEGSDESRTLMPVSIVSNPDDGGTLASVARVTNNGWEVGIIISALDRAGAEKWRVDSLPIDAIPPKLVAVPVRDKEFLGFYTNGVDAFSQDSLLQRTPFPSTETRNYAKLYGARVLRWVYTTSLAVDLLDMSGQPTGQGGSYQTQQTPTGIALACNDRDSSIVFVYGSNSGVRLIMFDRDLNPVIRAYDIPVSATTGKVTNPAAAFRNDTLFIVWEDYRNGVPDIYGTTVSMKTLLSVQSDALKEQPRPAIDVLPNPLSVFGILRYQLTERGIVSITISDPLGRIVAIPVDQKVQEGGEHQIVLSTETLDPGIYLCNLSTSGTNTVAKMIVVP